MGDNQRLPSVRVGTWVLTGLPADIDLVIASDLGDDLGSLLEQDCTVLVADMTRTGFCDSAGIRMLLLAHQQATRQGAELRLVISSPGVRRVLELTRTDQILQIFGTMSDALADAPAGVRAAQAAQDTA